MTFISGLFGASLVPIPLTTTDKPVDMIEFFGIKALVTGLPTYNLNTYFVGLETGAQPYSVPASGRLLLEYKTNAERQNLKNFYIRGTASADGYYVISHP